MHSALPHIYNARMDFFLGRKVIQYDWRHGKVYLLSSVAVDGLWLLLPLNISFKMICFLCQNPTRLHWRVCCPLKHPLDWFSRKFSLHSLRLGSKKTQVHPLTSGESENTTKHVMVCWERPRWRSPGWQRDVSYILLPTVRYSTHAWYWVSLTTISLK